MICYRDMTFCSAKCGQTECNRHFGEPERKAAEAWWGGPDAPIAFSDMSSGCELYIPLEDVTDE